MIFLIIYIAGFLITLLVILAILKFEGGCEHLEREELVNIIMACCLTWFIAIFIIIYHLLSLLIKKCLLPKNKEEK